MARGDGYRRAMTDVWDQLRDTREGAVIRRAQSFLVTRTVRQDFLRYRFQSNTQTHFLHIRKHSTRHTTHSHRHLSHLAVMVLLLRASGAGLRCADTPGDGEVPGQG